MSGQKCPELEEKLSYQAVPVGLLLHSGAGQEVRRYGQRVQPPSLFILCVIHIPIDDGEPVPVREAEPIPVGRAVQLEQSNDFIIAAPMAAKDSDIATAFAKPIEKLQPTALKLPFDEEFVIEGKMSSSQTAWPTALMRSIPTGFVARASPKYTAH